MTPDQFLACALSNRANVALLRRLATLSLKQCYLAAGCLFQPVWSARSGQSPDWGIKDYDVFYFDPDLSWDAEDAVIRQVDALTNDLGITVETRNQARVHLWYGQRFGGEYPALTSATDGIDRYLIACTCVGIEVGSGTVYAPDGFDDLASGILRINPRYSSPELFLRKAAEYQRRWPWLRIVSDERLSVASPESA